jgi:hypothetical protein
MRNALTARIRGGLMYPMRRASAFGLALGYSLSWILVCLSACMAASASAQHPCCAQEAGISAVQRDCCATSPTVTTQTPLVAHVPPSIATAAFSQPVVLRTLPAPVTPVRAAASPPLVLRV